ncbi:hypothetical protein [Verrucomicrobium spinosum]|uniref:hypothetical protein n=1 Tax=Verrucomicrobium spinosum TaxID=2736 RepID=UPI0012E2F932|nr:hypothetical protein [Verrucomicrobium spinosum]
MKLRTFLILSLCFLTATLASAQISFQGKEARARARRSSFSPGMKSIDPKK